VGYTTRANPGTFWVGNLRLVLDVQVSSGKQHSSGHAKTALARLLDELGDKRPALVRGDTGYGNEGILVELEKRDQPYLLRLRQTANVQRLVAQQLLRQDWSRADNHGCQMVEDWLQLQGWTKKRRVVIVRQRIKGGIARERQVSGQQLKLDLPGPSARLRAGLQLVELVLPGRQPDRENGGHHQQALATGGGGPDRAQRWADNAVPHADARKGTPAQNADHQYPSGLTACQDCCGADQVSRPMGHPAALRE